VLEKTQRPSTLGLCLLLAALSPALAAQGRMKTVQVSRTDNPPRIDGLIDDACWEAVAPVSGFFQHDPFNGQPASEETLVWITYDQKNIYFAFLMKDSQPQRIWAELTPRNEYENNDSITLLLDTYNDRRTSISFTVNPKGVQKNSVETIWQSGAQMRNDGWAAEMAIPFKSLRFSTQENQVWGVNFERYIYRLNETDYWTNVDRDQPLLQQMGELNGLSGVRPGRNLEFFPYAGFRLSRWEDEKDDKLAAGLDVKYGILPNLYLDATASPDFSEVESDPFLYQLSPYENYFQENRPFFTEGSRYFQLATAQEHEWESDNSLFYSRRIRNPRLAAKLSGKTGGYSFGLLGAINEDPDGDNTFSVVRIQKDIFKNSQVGIYFTGLHGYEADNQNIAVDYNFNFKDIYYLSGASAFSFNSGKNGAKNGLHLLQFQREPDAGLQLQASFQRIEPDVVVRTGFVNRVDIQTFAAMTGYAWRYNEGRIKRLSFDLSGNIEQDAAGRLTGNSLEFMCFTEFFSRVDLHGGFQVGKSKYQIRDDEDELAWTADFIKTYGGNLDLSWERGGFLKEVSLEGGWEKQGVYTADFSAVVPGEQTSVEGSLVFRPRSNFEWSFEGDWVRQSIDATGEKVFDGLTYETALHFQVTPSLFLNTRLLGETREKQYSLDFLVGYYFGAGNVVQLSFKKSERSALFGQESGYSVTLKVSYLLRI